jgi:hypothetical protein
VAKYEVEFESVFEDSVVVDVEDDYTGCEDLLEKDLEEFVASKTGNHFAKINILSYSKIGD